MLSQGVQAFLFLGGTLGQSENSNSWVPTQSCAGLWCQLMWLRRRRAATWGTHSLTLLSMPAEASMGACTSQEKPLLEHCRRKGNT